MATLNSALQIMTGALTADQGALDVTANNVANANTPGYAREVPMFQANDSVTINGISYGQGVQMTAAQSQRSLVLDAAVQQQTQTQQATNREASALTQVQSQVNSLSSVSLNEEAANLQTYEQAYQSASQVFSIIDTLVMSALNLGVQTAVT